MAIVRCNDLAVLECSLWLPLQGCWQAQLLLDTDDEAEVAPQSATLSLEAEGLIRTFTGTILQGNLFAGRGRVRVVGGAGGLGLPVSPKYYKGALARLIAQDTLSEVGETLSGASPLLEKFGRWVRRGVLCSEVLFDLVRELGTQWRVEDDGSVLLGEVTATPYEGEFRVIKDDPFRQCWQLDLPGVDLSPGQLLDERPVDQVEYFFRGGETKVSVRVGL